MRAFLLVLSLLLSPAPSAAVMITLAGPASGPLTSGVGVEATPGGQLTFTIGLASETEIGGYDLTLSWDDSELSLVAAQQLYPDTGSPVGFFPGPLTPPVTPAGKRVAVLPSFTPVATTTLFDVTFDVLARVVDGAPDVSIAVTAANGDGISPDTLIIDNPSGAGIDVVPEPGTALLLGLGLLGLGGRVRQRRA